MKKLILICGLAATCALTTHDISMAHGGTFRGPGDTAAPGSSGGSGGSTTSSPPSSGSTAPSGPGASGPSGGQAPKPKNNSTGPGTSLSGGPDPTQWNQWWGYNKDIYINLRGHLFAGTGLPSPEDYFLSHGARARKGIGVRPLDQTIRQTIVPALLEILETEKHNDIVTGALIALAKIGDIESKSESSALEQVFLPFLKSGSQEIAETAAVALGVLGNPQSIQTLQALLLDDEKGRKLVGNPSGVSTRTRAFAAYGLGQIGYYCESISDRQEIVAILWSVCESPKQSTRDVKVAAVTSMGLVELEAPSPNDVLNSTHSDAPRNRDDQVRYLCDLFTDKGKSPKPDLVRSHAPRAISSLMRGYGTEALKNHVVNALTPYVTKRGNQGSRELRQSACQALGLIGDLDNDPSDKKIRSSLMDAVGNTDPQVKNYSLMALGQVGSHPGNIHQPMAASMQVRKFLVAQLQDGQTQIRPWAALAIGVMEGGLYDNGQDQSQHSLGVLRDALKETRSEMNVGAYSIACGIARDTDAESILLEKFGSMSGDQVRGYTAVGLGLMNSSAAIAPLQATVKNSKYRAVLLKESAIALGILRDKSLVKQLLDMLAEAKTLSTQTSITAALGFIGDASSIAPLVSMLKEKDLSAGARGFAAVALGIVADKEHLPWNTKFSVNINYRANVPTLSDSAGKGLLDIL
jgi:HEAT repeat protein